VLTAEVRLLAMEPTILALVAAKGGSGKTS